MSNIIDREFEILSKQCNNLLKNLLFECVQSQGDLNKAEKALSEVIHSLRSVLVSSAMRTCITASNRNYICPDCGLSLTHWSTIDRIVVTCSGEGRFPSERYYCRGCKTSHYPWQVANGLDEKNKFTLTARQWIAEESAQGPFDVSSKRLERMGITVSVSETDRISREVAVWRKQEQDAVRAFSCLHSKDLPLSLHDWTLWPEEPLGEDHIVISVDGAKVRSNEVGPKGLEWFEVRAGLIRFCSDPKRSCKVCVGGVMDADTLFETLSSQWRQVPRNLRIRLRGEDISQPLHPNVFSPNKQKKQTRLVFCADGAEWIWQRVRMYFPECIQILDPYHASEHVGSAARAAWGSESNKTQQWIEKAMPWLLEEDGPIRLIKELLHVLRSGKAVDPEQLKTEFRYLWKHRHRMQYSQWRDKGLSIGSGCMESSIKQISTQRLSQSGMMWTRTNADLMMNLRAAVLSGSLELTIQRERKIRNNRAQKYYTKQKVYAKAV